MQTDHPYSKIKRGIGTALMPVLLSLLLLPSCSREGDALPDMPDTPDGSGLCEATIRLDIGTFSQAGSAGTREAVAGYDDENRIKNIWVFQYDAEADTSLHEPVYSDDFQSDAIEQKIELKQSEAGVQSIVCIVANIGKPADDGQPWALDENGLIREEFKTYTSFLQQAIPTAATSPFISSNMGETGNIIPMFGVSEAMPITSKCYVSVPMIRMFARVDVSFDPANIDAAKKKIDNIKFFNIPNYCRVGTLATGEALDGLAAYPNNISWKDFDTNSTTAVTLYLPENLQGKVAGMTSKTPFTEGASFPPNAFKIDLAMSDTEGTSPQKYTYTIYPGLDMVNDFNIKRNHIYNVNIKFNKPSE